MKYKIIYVVIVISLIIFLPRSLSYGQPENYMDKIESIRIAFFTERLDLTTEEAQKFWPVYKDFSNRREKINEDRRLLFRYIMKNGDFLSDKEINESLDKYLNLSKEETSLNEVFNQKFLNILPPKKVIKIYITENQFKAYILNQIKERRPNNQGQRGRAF